MNLDNYNFGHRSGAASVKGAVNPFEPHTSWAAGWNAGARAARIARRKAAVDTRAMVLYDVLNKLVEDLDSLGQLYVADDAKDLLAEIDEEV